MNKAELIKNIANQNKIALNEAEIMVNAVTEGIMTSLIENEKLQIKGFGSFEVTKHNNLFELVFKAGKTFNQIINKIDIIDELSNSKGFTKVEVEIIRYAFEYFRPREEEVRNTLDIELIADDIGYEFEEVDAACENLIDLRVLTSFDFGKPCTISLPKRFYKFYHS
ncbi:HU family DNA-binding protein [Alkalihalophilus marmarensis]|uniref:HU family DNA-binding protein n=1 Tax=Alkalihalophilus marmarensis TaxID=521377 RepID=UPI002E2210EC|nr:HU family DNA-binding protein [Alkalihalophilus marmarensis]MED1603280.1 HU family DNA-binding protein [Alkalihalophilus marmarensis]